MVNKKTYEWLRQLAQYEPFKEVTALSDRPLEEAYDIEIVLRFMVLHSLPEKDLKNIGDVGDFLTDKMMELARDKSFQYKRNERVFKETFDILATTVGESAFKRFNTQKKRHEGGFLLSQFEVVGLGVAYNIRNETLIPNADIPKKTRGIWSTKEYIDWAGSGIRASSRVPRLVPLGRAVFSKD